jgi:SagB-type dehydrogenase family enzyme
MSRETRKDGGVLLLPTPKEKGRVSVEEAIASRRTRRRFSEEPLPLEALSQLLWAAQGVTGKDGHLRAAPSGGALYPLDIYAVVGRSSVEGLDPGVYCYLPHRNGLREILSGDLRASLARDCLGQHWTARAPVSLVVTAEYERIESKYGTRGRRYAIMESGHAGQNIFLQAEALGLAAGIVGAFHDKTLAHALHLPPSHHPLLVMPVGYPEKPF